MFEDFFYKKAKICFIEIWIKQNNVPHPHVFYVSFGGWLDLPLRKSVEIKIGQLQIREVISSFQTFSKKPFVSHY